MYVDRKRSIGFVFLILLMGVIISSIISQFVGNTFPEGVVKDFFLSSKSIGWGATTDNWVELSILRVKTGLFIDISVVSFLGLIISWYFLRYFK